MPAATVVPRTQDQTAAGGGDRQEALDRGMRIRAVEPAAVTVDGRARCLDVMPIVVGAKEVDTARCVDRCADWLEAGSKLVMVWIRRGHVVAEGQRECLAVHVVVVAMRGDGAGAQRPVVITLHRLDPGHGELEPPARDLVRRVAVERVVVSPPGLGEPRGMNAAGECDVGVGVEERKARRDGAYGGMSVDEQKL